MKFLSDLSNLMEMDKFIGLCYQVHVSISISFEFLYYCFQVGVQSRLFLFLQALQFNLDMCCRLTFSHFDPLDLKNQVKNLSTELAKVTGKVSQLPAKLELEHDNVSYFQHEVSQPRECIADLEPQLSFLSKIKEELGNLLEYIRCAKMQCKNNLLCLQKNWTKEKEELCEKVFQQLTHNLLALDEKKQK